MRVFRVGIATIWLCGCAHVPGNPPASSALVARTQPTGSPAPARVQAVGRGPGAAQHGINQDLIKRGYVARTVHGNLLYCRQQQITGSMFENKVCLTEAQIKAADVDLREKMDRTAPLCSTLECRQH